MENRNIQGGFQPFLNFKAAGSTDIFQVDSSEAGSHPGYRLDDFLRVLCVKADGNGIDAAEFFKKDGLPFHDGHSGIGADVPKAQDRGAVGYHGNGVGLDGIGISGFLIIGYHLAWLRHAGGIGE